LTRADDAAADDDWVVVSAVSGEGSVRPASTPAEVVAADDHLGGDHLVLVLVLVVVLVGDDNGNENEKRRLATRLSLLSSAT